MRWVAPTERDDANHQLEKRLWDAADQFRANSGLKAGQYSTPVLGLIFLRFAEARFAQRRAQLERSGASARRGTSRIDDPPDISHVMQGIKELLDRSIGAEPFKIKEKEKASGTQGIDLSKIDFEKLAKRFEKKKPTSSDLERLKAAVKAQLERMVRLNRTRADYLEKFEALIEAYNNGSRNIEEIFRDLIALARVLTEEQGRHLREHLSEEELTIFDILTRPGPELSTAERDEVKKVARQLLERLNALLILGWRQKVQSRARVRIEIEDSLDGLPRAYSKETYQAKCNVLFEHVYESYMSDGKSSYTEAA
jgi:type I restriction enzyme R subunit